MSVMDYQTGEQLSGMASEELEAASAAAGDTGAVRAYQDAEGTWQHVPTGDAEPDGTRTVYCD